MLFVQYSCSALFLELKISTMFNRLINPAGQGSKWLLSDRGISECAQLLYLAV